MNDSSFGPALPATPPLGASGVPGGSPKAEGISAFAVLVGVSFLVLVAFFAMSIVAVWKRSHAEPSPTLPMPIASPGSTRERSVPVTEEVWFKGTVYVAKGVPGILRGEPRLDGALVVFVPNGADVEMGRTATAPGASRSEAWYHVRAVVKGKQYEGWMHSDILLPSQPLP